MSSWKDMDKDDIPGYLLDHIAAWLDKEGIEDMFSYGESHQSDSFLEDKDNMMDEIVEAVLEYQKDE